MTKVLIVSDSHGENENINVLKLKHNCDLVIHAGDFNNYDGNPTVLELNDAHKHFDYFVNGNHFINGKTHKSFNNIDDYKKHIKDTDPFESAANDYKIFKIEGINFLLIHNIKYHEALLSYYGKYKELNKGEEE
jgi:predicted phosphodiesterase